MTLRTMTVALPLSATAALAQSGPGVRFMESWDLDTSGTASVEELREMRASVFLSFDANEDGALDAEEYLVFDAARQNDVDGQEGAQRGQMQRVADRMSLPVNDLDENCKATREEFIAGADS